MRASRVCCPLIAAVAAVGLGGCSSDAAPSATATTRVTVTVTATPSGSRLLDLRTVCDHVSSAFRDGGLGDQDQDRALAQELQGMIDVGRPEVERALGPVRDSAEAIAAAGRDLAPAGLRAASNAAYATLQRTCHAAGSTALD